MPVFLQKAIEPEPGHEKMQALGQEGLVALIDLKYRMITHFTVTYSTAKLL